MDSIIVDRIRSVLSSIEKQVSDSRAFQVFDRDGKIRESFYSRLRVIGNGSFGIVCASQNLMTKEDVAIKIVYQDKRFKNRELQIMKQLSHPNIVELKEYFYRADSNGDTYLNLVLEYLPDTVFGASQYHARQKRQIPNIQIKLYIYQLLRALAYIHSLGICHRDIKPQNLLLDPSNGLVKICDFGSAKMLAMGEPSVSYICSRYYRAPELLLGADDYTTGVDIWSAGCVMGELFLGSPLFPGTNETDQLIQIFRILGIPTAGQKLAINFSSRPIDTTKMSSSGLKNAFNGKISHDAIDLMKRLLEYDPSKRITAIEALFHRYFAELRTLPAVVSQNMPTNMLLFTDKELDTHPELNGFHSLKY